MHRARKRFGQNFLQNQSIINRIVEAISPQATDKLIEIGPGLGALTLPLLARCDHMTAVELDRDLVARLQSTLSPEKLSIISQDVLTVDFSDFGEGLRIVGNLPYNISTPIMMHLLQQGDQVKDMHFMLQKEVVDRLAAEPGNKQYGRLSVIAQFACQVTALFDVPPQSFEPAPKVMSAIVRLKPKSLSESDQALYPKLKVVVKQAFAMRRKTLRNNLKGLLSDDAFEALAIDPLLRPEAIGVEQYVQMTEYLIGKKHVS